MCQWGVLSQDQAAEHFYDGVASRAEYRVHLMRDAGLLRTSTDSRWAGVVMWATPKAARAFGSVPHVPGSNTPSVTAGAWPGDRLLHRLAAADAGLGFAKAGRTVVAERVIRRLESLPAGVDRTYVQALPTLTSAGGKEDGKGRQRWLSVPVGAHGSAHWSDLIVVVGGRLVPIEVELTPKPSKDWLRILRAYRDAPEVFGQVIYLATEQVTRALIGRPGPDGAGWEDGLAHTAGLLPSGTGNPPVPRRDSRLIVQPFNPTSPRLRYALDMRLHAERPVTYAQWQRWRVAWQADVHGGETAGVPWTAWLASTKSRAPGRGY